MPFASFWNLAGPDLIVLALIAIFIGVPIAIALALNRRFQRRNPGKRPFRWGVLLQHPIIRWRDRVGIQPQVWIIAVIVCGAIYGVLAWFFARRDHWAWITLTILSCNPVAWIINLIYLRKRWSEDSVQTPTI